MTQKREPGDSAPLTCWAVSDGRRGMENQALGLAEALGRLTPVQIETKRIAFKAPARWLPYSALGAGVLDPDPLLSGTSDSLKAPWPDILISCGRLTVAASIAVRLKSRGRTFTVQTQHPRCPVNRFDMVIPPEHDRLSGPNVLPILGSPHRVTPEILEAAKPEFDAQFGALPRPLAAVLIGGDSKAYRLTEERLGTIARRLRALSDQGVGLAITTSRRTGAANELRLRKALEGRDIYFWDGNEPNPYFAMLAHADVILVTAESTNMVTEAAATGKPVYILPLDGGSPKFDHFHEAMEAREITRVFTGTLDSWSYEPLLETPRAAQAILERFQARRRNSPTDDLDIGAVNV